MPSQTAVDGCTFELPGPYQKTHRPRFSATLPHFAPLTKRSSSLLRSRQTPETNVFVSRIVLNSGQLHVGGQDPVHLHRNCIRPRLFIQYDFSSMGLRLPFEMQFAGLTEISSVSEKGTKRTNPPPSASQLPGAAARRLTVGRVKQDLLDGPDCVKHVGRRADKVAPKLWPRLSLQRLPHYRWLKRLSFSPALSLAADRQANWGGWPGWSQSMMRTS